ncbi:hypothetical protein BRARA_G00334 [Brassica rapa]|uniref:RRM domain-containing protein n=1 Tax=Brassica campestris TaxID=3711 RepID=A0A397YLT6_BRACM|nr:hypothetical protein BRARA_G00334 [Brassica rapa]
MDSAESEYRCFVGGLAWATDEQSLGRTFSEFGEVLDSKIIIDRETGRSKGFGFVTFKDEESMRAAIERMNGQELDGRNITVNEAQARSSRGGNGGGYNRGGGGYGGGGYGSETRREQRSNLSTLITTHKSSVSTVKTPLKFSVSTRQNAAHPHVHLHRILVSPICLRQL